MTDSLIASIATQFADDATIIEIKPLGHGLINDTYLITTLAKQFVLQRVNHQVFAQPEQTILNLQTLSEHLQRLPSEQVLLEIPAILQTQQNKFFFIDQAQQFWRALAFIAESESRETISRTSEAEQVGFALGHFHTLCCDLPINSLADTLPGFHITPQYFQTYQALIQQKLAIKPSSDYDFCQQFIAGFSAQINLLEQAKHQQLLLTRVIHGDPKLNNFLFQANTDKIISLIDLDTVKPGLVHYDIGDCLRSTCHRLPENRFDIELAEVILSAYIAQVKEFFTDADYYYLFAAIQLIPFELGLRFFCDYLAGNSFVAQDSQPEIL